jgi:peptidoglycan/LPS O-acetylase OafA/YrhL
MMAPLLVWPLLSRRYWLILAASIYGALIFWNHYAVGYLNWSYDGRNIVANLPHFLIGIIGCRLAFTGFVTLNKARYALIFGSALVLAAAGMLGYANWMYHRQPALFWSERGILCVDTVILLVIIAHVNFTHGFKQKSIRPSPLYAAFALLGTLSYGIYAWHGYFLQYHQWFSNQTTATIVVSFLAAYVSYRLIEAPALKLKRYS